MSNECPLVLGIDIGTSSLKAALLTKEDFPVTVLSQSNDFKSVATLNITQCHGNSQRHEHEQDVSKIFQCLHVLLSRIPQPLIKRVNAISICGQMHGVVGWLGDNLAFNNQAKREKQRLEVTSSSGGCGRLVTWLDRRCTNDFLKSLPQSSHSHKPFSGFGCATLLWHMFHKSDEFSLTPVGETEQQTLYEKTAVLRKTSVGARVIRTVINNTADSIIDQNSPRMKSRSTSQIIPPHHSCLLQRQHVPWTCVGTIADFLVAGLTELKCPVMSPQMAMSWGYYDIQHHQWDFQALDATGYNLKHLLPTIVPCGTVVGPLAFDWEGIPAGADVYVALGDLQCSVYPFLERDDLDGQIAACNMSTSAQIAFKLPETTPDNSNEPLASEESTFDRLLRAERISVWPFFKPTQRLVVAASVNGGNIIDRFVKMLRSWCRQLGCPALEISQIYSRLAQQRSVMDFHLGEDSKTLIIDPRLFPERFMQMETNQSGGEEVASESWSGANVCFQPGDLINLPSVYASLCKGIVRNLASLAPPELLNWANVNRMYCTGGALKKNPLLFDGLQHTFTPFGIECISENGDVEACVGAALFAIHAENNRHQ